MEPCTAEVKKRPLDEPGPHNMETTTTEENQAEVQLLWDSQRQKDAQILVLQKKLSHYRSWINGLQNRVQQQNPQALKNAKRLYVGGFPAGTKEEELRLFLSQLLMQTGGCSQPGNAVVSVKIMKDKNFAFAEFRSVEETANATAFDGVVFDSSRLKIRRPSNYDIGSAILLGPVTPDPTMDLSCLDICRSTVDDSPHKLFIGGLPYDYTEEQVRDLVGAHAAVKSFNLVMDRTTGKSKGFAFCELVDESLTDFVIQQLNAYKLGSKLLTVKRAMEGGKNTSSQMLQTMLNTVGGPPAVPADVPNVYSPPNQISALHNSLQTGCYNLYSPQNVNPHGLMMHSNQNVLAGLSSNIGSSGSMIMGTPMSNGSMQANNMLTQLMHGGHGLLSQNPSLGSLNGEGIPVPEMRKSIVGMQSYGTPRDLPESFDSLGGGSLQLGPTHDLKLDPEMCHSYNPNLLSSSLLSRSLDEHGWKLGKP